MKWYGIMAFLLLLGGLAGIVIIGMNASDFESKHIFGEPNKISEKISNPPPSYVTLPQSSKKICDQWQQELINVGVKKSLTDTRYLDYPEFQSLLQKEYDLEQKLLLRCS